MTEEDKAQMFVDIMPEGPEDDGVAYLNFYLEEDADKDVILRDVRNALEELRTFMDIERVRLKSLRQRIRTGSTTGKNFSISSMWMISPDRSVMGRNQRRR